MHLFRPDEGQDKAIRASLAEAHDILNFAQEPHFEKFMAWLRKEWERPKVIADHVKLIEQVARENAFKEVHQHLHSEIASARRLLESQKEQ